jgi:hypothetical protein
MTDDGMPKGRSMASFEGPDDVMSTAITDLPTGSAGPVLSATAKAYNAVPPRLPAKMYSGVTVEYHAVPRRVHAARIVPHGSVRQHHSRRGERDSPTVQCNSLAAELTQCHTGRQAATRA